MERGAGRPGRPDARRPAYEEPGEFTNFASPAVRQYNLDIALDAVNRGVDDILWDDARKPGGEPESMLVPGMNGSPEDAIVAFLAESHTDLGETLFKLGQKDEAKKQLLLALQQAPTYARAQDVLLAILGRN